MLQYFQNAVSLGVSFSDFIINIVVACACGVLHVIFYRAAYRGPGYSVSFLNSLVMLSMITAIVIMVIGDSLARAFGLVGAMSIIRFRTAVKDTMDIVQIFFALAIGMAAGVGMHSVVLGGTIFVGLMMLALMRLNVVPSEREQYLLQFNYTLHQNGAEPQYIHSIAKHCKHSKLVNVKTLNHDDGIELSYYVHPKKKDGVAELLSELRNTDGINTVSVFSDDERF
jgi:uncharacterized membrane protein YhiD involved in acid resistance